MVVELRYMSCFISQDEEGFTDPKMVDKKRGDRPDYDNAKSKADGGAGASGQGQLERDVVDRAQKSEV